MEYLIDGKDTTAVQILKSLRNLEMKLFQG